MKTTAQEALDGCLAEIYTREQQLQRGEADQMNAGPHLPPFMPELHRIYETAARHLEAVSRLLAARADEEPRDLGEDFLPAIATEIGAAWTVH